MSSCMVVPMSSTSKAFVVNEVTHPDFGWVIRYEAVEATEGTAAGSTRSNENTFLGSNPTLPGLRSSMALLGYTEMPFSVARFR